jgi:hypothetical protein
MTMRIIIIIQYAHGVIVKIDSDNGTVYTLINYMFNIYLISIYLNLYMYNTNLHAISMVKVLELLLTNFLSTNENKQKSNKVQ